MSATLHAGFADPTEHWELRAAVRSLANVDRDIIALGHWDGFSLIEASRILRMKEVAVRSRYHRARAHLRELLRNESTEPSHP